MTTFDEAKHPRGHHTNPGSFSEKGNSGPEGDLLAAAAAADNLDAEALLDAANEAQELESGWEDLYWGKTGVSEGSRTPWGTADYTTDLAPGVTSVGTPGHGGVKLSKERNAVIPAALRDSSGWYEEDCAWAIAATYHPEAFTRGHRSVEEVRESAHQTVKNWFPSEWEAANGRELRPGESREKDKKTWAAAHAGNFITTSAITSEVDKDWVRVTARTSDGDDGEFMVPKAEYATRNDGAPGQDGRFVIDPAKHPRLTPAPKPKAVKMTVATVAEDTVSASALSQAYIDGAITETKRDRVAKDLGKLWRDSDGNVSSLRDTVTQNGVALNGYEENGKMSYAVIQPGPGSAHAAMKVSKATFEYLSDQLPDARTPAHRAQQEASAYQERIYRRPGGPTPAEAERARSRQAEASRLREEARAADIAANGTYEERERVRKAEIIERERAALGL